jgi:hypothetical protein
MSMHTRLVNGRKCPECPINDKIASQFQNAGESECGERCSAHAALFPFRSSAFDSSFQRRNSHISVERGSTFNCVSERNRNPARGPRARFRELQRETGGGRDYATKAKRWKFDTIPYISIRSQNESSEIYGFTLIHLYKFTARAVLESNRSQDSLPLCQD